MYVVIWEFEVRPERAAEFRFIYSPEGEWARLFRQSDGYRSTELLRSSENAHCFLTIDRWASPQDYANFQQNFREQYLALDLRCEGLTLSERRIGAFAEIDR
jgi:heme-degrading monooxygenase HmoA